MIEKEYCKCGKVANPSGAGPFTGGSDMCTECRAKYVADTIKGSIVSSNKGLLLELLRQLPKEEILAIVSGILKQ